MSSSSEISDDDDDSSSSSEEWWEDSDDDNEDHDDDAVVLGPRSLLWLCQEGQMDTARKRFELLKGLSEKERQKQRQLQSQTNKMVQKIKSDYDNSKSSLYQQQLHREIFQQAPSGDKNYPIHEILMGGLDDRNAQQLVVEILDYCCSCSCSQNLTTLPQSKNNDSATTLWPSQLVCRFYRQMLISQPPSHKRTPLHWAVWSKTSIHIIRKLILGNPEALVLKDSVGRTPLDIYRHYYIHDGGRCQRVERQSANQHHIHQRIEASLQEATSSKDIETKNENIDPYLDLLEKTTKSWTQHRVRVAIHLCTLRYFSLPSTKLETTSCSSSPSKWPPPPCMSTKSVEIETTTTSDGSLKRSYYNKIMLTPFDKKDRKQAQITPRNWFVLSVLGTCVQMEMKPLLNRILEYAGGNAAVRTTSSKRKTIRKKNNKTDQKQNPPHTQSQMRKTPSDGTVIAPKTNCVDCDISTAATPTASGSKKKRRKR